MDSNEPKKRRNLKIAKSERHPPKSDVLFQKKRTEKTFCDVQRLSMFFFTGKTLKA
jgi:hypothetical protein